MLDSNGKYIGPMITWEVVTDKVETEKREAETAADIRAVNQLLLALGRSRTIRDVITRRWLRCARRSTGHTVRSGRSTPRSKHCDSCTMRDRSAKNFAA